MLGRQITKLLRVNRGVELLVWCLPAILIPAARFTQDDKDVRGKLFIRDFSTYTLGAACYFAGKFSSLKLLARCMPDAAIREPVAFMTGLLANIGFAGFGSVYLSNYLDRRFKLQRPKGVPSLRCVREMTVPAPPLRSAPSPPAPNPARPMGAYQVFTRIG